MSARWYAVVATALVVSWGQAKNQATPGFIQTRDFTATGKFDPVGTSSISGLIVTDDNPARPLRRAVVTIDEFASTIQPRVVTSDETGRFIFRNLPAGRYSVSANRPPYVRGAYGARRVAGPGHIQTGTVIVVPAGKDVTNIDVVLSRGSVITGMLRDADGQPARGFRVNAHYMARSSTTGHKVLTSFTTTTTDDRGVYRLYGLRPGTYFVSASGGTQDGTFISDLEIARATEMLQRPGMASAAAPYAAPTSTPPPRRPTVGYTPVLFPGVTDMSQALPVIVGVGEERQGVDFQMQLMPTARLEVTVSFPSSGIKARAQVRVTPSGPASGLGSQGVSTYSTNDQNRAIVPGLAPGMYRVQVSTAGADVPILAAATDIQISGADAAVSVALQPPVTVSGRVVFEGTSLKPPADLTKTRIQLTGDSLFGGNAVAIATGEFTVPNVLPGRYQLSAALPLPSHESGWYLKSAVIGGQETLDTAVEIRTGMNVTGAVITMTDRPTEIAGAMTDATGAAATEYFIIVFAADQSFWTPGSRRILQTRPSSDGSFVFRNLPPGEYRLAAVTEVQQGEWFDPEFLGQLLDASIKLTLTEGGKIRQDLRIK